MKNNLKPALDVRSYHLEKITKKVSDDILKMLNKDSEDIGAIVKYLYQWWKDVLNGVLTFEKDIFKQSEKTAKALFENTLKANLKEFSLTDVDLWATFAVATQKALAKLTTFYDFDYILKTKTLKVFAASLRLIYKEKKDDKVNFNLIFLASVRELITVFLSELVAAVWDNLKTQIENYFIADLLAEWIKLTNIEILTVSENFAYFFNAYLLNEISKNLNERFKRFCDNLA